LVATEYKKPARQRLLEAASRLFYAYGVTATGIDAITGQAGTAKMSLYNNFSSKDDLILAYLLHRHEELLEFYNQRLNQAKTSQARILAIFDAYIDHARIDYEGGFRGCGLLNAAAEFPAGSLGRARVCEHKEQIQSLIHDQLENSGYANPGQLAAYLALLLEGAMSRAGLEHSTELLFQARNMATSLLEAQ